MEPAEQRAAAGLMKPVQYKVSQVIYEEGIDFTDSIYIICKGIVQLSKKEPGQNERYPKVLGPGDIFGLDAKGFCRPREESAKAQSHTCLLTIKQCDFETLRRTAQLN